VLRSKPQTKKENINQLCRKAAGGDRPIVGDHSRRARVLGSKKKGANVNLKGRGSGRLRRKRLTIPGGAEDSWP